MISEKKRYLIEESIVDGHTKETRTHKETCMPTLSAPKTQRTKLEIILCTSVMSDSLQPNGP